MRQSAWELVTIVSEPFAENTYIANLPGRRDCLVVDPGLTPRTVIASLDERQLTPAAILLTHGHADHIAGNRALKQRWPTCPLVIGAGDAPKLGDARLNLSADYGLPLTSPAADRLVVHGERLSAAGFDLEVYEIPGHSCGHVVFVWRSEPVQVFGGDVLFAGSVGRTDFPDGDFSALRQGIREHLFTLPADTIIWPGHGPATTVGQEHRHNPFVGIHAAEEPFG